MPTLISPIHHIQSFTDGSRIIDCTDGAVYNLDKSGDLYVWIDEGDWVLVEAVQAEQMREAMAGWDAAALNLAVRSIQSFGDGSRLVTMTSGAKFALFGSDLVMTAEPGGDLSPTPDEVVKAVFVALARA